MILNSHEKFNLVVGSTGPRTPVWFLLFIFQSHFGNQTMGNSSRMICFWFASSVRRFQVYNSSIMRCQAANHDDKTSICCSIMCQFQVLTMSLLVTIYHNLKYNLNLKPCLLPYRCFFDSSIRDQANCPFSINVHIRWPQQISISINIWISLSTTYLLEEVLDCLVVSMPLALSLFVKNCCYMGRL